MRRLASLPSRFTRQASRLQAQPHEPPCLDVPQTRLASTGAQATDSSVGAGRASAGVRGDGLVARFYKTVAVVKAGDGWHVTLDGRKLRTPAKAELLIPTHALALAVAAEWEWQDAKSIRPFTMPLMGLCSTAVDRIPLTRGPTITQLLKFFETDSLCVRSDNPQLASQQAAVWDPLLDWVQQELGARPAVSDSIFGPQQPQAVVEAFTHALVRADDWQLAGITAASAAARSLVAAFALARGRIRPAEASHVLRVEENFQTEEWGVVEGGHDIDVADLAARCAAPAVFLDLLLDTDAVQ